MTTTYDRTAENEAAIRQSAQDAEVLTTVLAVKRRLENALGRQRAAAERTMSDGVRASLWSQVGMAEKLLGLMARTPEARALHKTRSQEAYRLADEAIARTDGRSTGRG